MTQVVVEKYRLLEMGVTINYNELEYLESTYLIHFSNEINAYMRERK